MDLLEDDDDDELGLPAWAQPMPRRRVEHARPEEYLRAVSPKALDDGRRVETRMRLSKSAFANVRDFEKRRVRTEATRSAQVRREVIDARIYVCRVRSRSRSGYCAGSLSFDVGNEQGPTTCDPRDCAAAASRAMDATSGATRVEIGKRLTRIQLAALPRYKPLARRRESSKAPAPAKARPPSHVVHAVRARLPQAPPPPPVEAPAAANRLVTSSPPKRDDNTRAPVSGQRCRVVCVLTAKQAKKLSPAARREALVAASRTRRLHRPIVLSSSMLLENPTHKARG